MYNNILNFLNYLLRMMLKMYSDYLYEIIWIQGLIWIYLSVVVVFCIGLVVKLWGGVSVGFGRCLIVYFIGCGIWCEGVLMCLVFIYCKSDF